MNLSNQIKVDMVDMREVTDDPNAQILLNDGEASVDHLDLVTLTAHIFEILEYLEKPDVKKICKKDDSVIRMALINKYANTVPLKFIDLFMEDDKSKAESIDRTMKWIETFARVQAGEVDLEKSSQDLVNEVNERYAYKEYGGKEGFDAALRKNLSVEQNSSKAKFREF